MGLSLPYVTGETGQLRTEKLVLTFEVDVTTRDQESTWQLTRQLGASRVLLGRWHGDLSGLRVAEFDDMMTAAMKSLGETLCTSHMISESLF